MGKKHKHEEHVNHERWVISFADMMTLLFALFVVLYALGQADLTKLKKLKESVQFAFHIAGEGKTRDEGIFDKQKGGGEATLPAPLINAQDGAMREFLQETLPREFEEVTGKSLEVVQTDDTVSMRAPLSAFFQAGRPHPIQRDVYNWLVKAAQGSLTFTSDIRVIIDAPDVILGAGRDGRPVTSLELCDRRLWTLRKALLGIPEVQPHMVRIELAQQRDSAPGSVRAGADWEDRGMVTLAFSNAK
ncbi:MAG: flagellar motor protein MotB [Planctomycetota bacterium]